MLDNSGNMPDVLTKLIEAEYITMSCGMLVMLPSFTVFSNNVHAKNLHVKNWHVSVLIYTN